MGDVCLGGVCIGGVCLGGVHLPPWTEFLTHACENITFPQLLFRTVKMLKDPVQQFFHCSSCFFLGSILCPTWRLSSSV